MSIAVTGALCVFVWAAIGIVIVTVVAACSAQRIAVAKWKMYVLRRLKSKL